MTLDPAVVIAAIGALATALGAAARLVYRDMRRDIDRWQELALSLAKVNEKSIEVNEKLARDG